MKKLLVAAAVSCSFFIVGAYLLTTIKNSPKPAPELAVNAEPTVHDGIYEEAENCDEPLDPNADTNDIQLELLVSTKPFGPEEAFLAIEDGQTLHSILRPLGVSEQEIAMLSSSLRPHLRVTDLAAKDHYRFVVGERDGITRIHHLSIRKIDPNRIPIVYRASRENSQQVFRVAVIAPPVTETIERVDLTVGATLYQTFTQIPFGTDVMQRLMGIFSWQLRMPQDVLPGDEIQLLVVKRYIYDDFIGFGKIQTAIYRQKTRTLAGIFFTSKDKKIHGFFDENGKSLEKEFAVSPVYETTATSNQKWRMHPVRKIRMRHNGVDYRGAIGTEFFSIADGEVIEKRFDVNVGNMIRVLHKYGVHSEYFHADSLADNISVGSRVRRGQLLGTIGRTGRLCTGPHLHMGLYTMNGNKKKFIELSSLRSKLKPAPDVTSAYLAEFALHQKTLLAKLHQEKGAAGTAGVQVASPAP